MGVSNRLIKSGHPRIPGKVSKPFGIEITEITAGVFEDERLEELVDIRFVSLLTESPLDTPRSVRLNVPCYASVALN